MRRPRLLTWVLLLSGSVLLLPVVLLSVLVVGLRQLPAAASPSSIALTDIPTTLLPLYAQAVASCPGLDWTVLAGVGKVESDHNRPPDQVSSAGAQGVMQFLPATWHAHGVDGNADGAADPFDPADAIPAAADYLCRLGADRDTRTALAAYTCGDQPPCRQRALAPGGYVTRVLDWAASYADVPSIDSNAASPLATVAVQVALAQLGTPYVWGGDGPDGFDCSGLVQYAYAQVGIRLPRVAQQQHDRGPTLPDNTQPATGDLVFFGPDPAHVTHVGIWIGDGRMVDAPHTGALVRVEPVAGFEHYLGATRPTALQHPDGAP